MAAAEQPNPPDPPAKDAKSGWRPGLVWLSALLVLGLAAYAIWPRAAHLRDFDSDRVAIGWYAARAARTFQPSRSREQAQAALPLLERYFAVIRAHGGETFDASEAARIELDWWQLRRENSVPVDYGRVIARVTTVVFHADNADVALAGRVRAEMMTYRDERREGRMQEADWAHIERELTRSYRALRAGIATR